jgi:hypothetical protein
MNERNQPDNFQELSSELQRALHHLQDQMASLDLLWEPSHGNGLELLLKKHKLLALKMDGNRNHGRPHLHLDYHRKKHMASYAIDNGQLLAGDGTYDGVVQPWIAQNRINLIKVWNDIRGSGPDLVIVAQLQASTI